MWRTIFPNREPASTKVENGKSEPLPQPQAQPVPGPEGAPKPGPRCCRRRRASRSETPSLQRIDQPQGRADRRSLAGPPATTIEKNRRRSGSCRRSERPARTSRNSAGPAKAEQLPGLNTVWTADSTELTPGRPVTLSWTQMPDGVHSRSDRPSMTTICSPSSRARRTLRASPSLCVRSASSAAPTSRSRSGQLDQPRRAVDRLRRDRRLRHQLTGRWTRGRQKLFERQRLARLHRQILADRAGASGQCRSEDFRRSPSGGYQADFTAAPDRSARPGDHDADPTVRGRQGI